jgi:hypothetical protein
MSDPYKDNLRNGFSAFSGNKAGPGANSNKIAPMGIGQTPPGKTLDLSHKVEMHDGTSEGTEEDEADKRPTEKVLIDFGKQHTKLVDFSGAYFSEDLNF